MRWFAVFVIAISFHAHAQESGSKRPVKVVAEARMPVVTSAGSGTLPVYVSRDWNAPLPGVTRALVVWHGVSRNADGYFDYAQKALKAAARQNPAIEQGTIIIAPQFLNEADAGAHSLSADTLRWHSAAWEGGDPALAPAAISSFEAMDAILARLADRRLFPALKNVVVAGHSGGGQVVQRYAVTGRGEAALAAAGIKIRYVVANPSSYLYFSAERPAGDGRFAIPAAGACPAYNQWKYGWDNASSYVKWAAPAELERGYAGRDVIYLLGTADTDPAHPALDKTCSGELQGPYRYARGLSYLAYIRGRNPGIRHRLFEVEGVGHEGERMLTSTCGMDALFDLGKCAAK